MVRDSGKHGPNLDDELKHETEGMVRGGHPTHAEEWKETEPVDDPRGRTMAEPPERAPGTVGDMTPREVAWRSELAQMLAPVDYPTDRGRLLSFLEGRHAPDQMLTAISTLPKDREFHNLGEIARALGIHTEDRRV